MANDLIYKSDARRAILKADPSLAYVIDEVKAVDVKEVVHGSWERVGYTGKLSEKRVWRYVCSECKLFGNAKWAYCPSCGAKMDGGKVLGEA